jgi:hypothetical protein
LFYGDENMNKLESVLLLAASVLVGFVAVRNLWLNRTPEQAQIGVSDLIHTLTEELKRNQTQFAPKKGDPYFTVSGATVELAFVVKETNSTGGSASLGAFAVTAGNENANEIHHTLKVTLIPPDDEISGSSPPTLEGGEKQ